MKVEITPRGERKEGGLALESLDRATPVGAVKALRGLRPRRALRYSPESPAASL